MKTIIVCVNHRTNPDQPSCGARGGITIADCLEAEIARNQLNISIERFKCLGVCERGPNLKIMPSGHFVYAAQLADIPTLVSKASADISTTE
ncbi:MAG: (2Fe-2S) ferredoxin domain-containing protein [Nitrosomonadales bacterium]|nr:(2Fe-2S) ferredoxin domain-containing protein [Nitrosomonadales bacterium]